MMVEIWQSYTVDCRLVPAYERAPDLAAELLSNLVMPGDQLMAGTVCLGEIKRVLAAGPQVRFYFKPDPSVEISTYHTGGN